MGTPCWKQWFLHSECGIKSKPLSTATCTLQDWSPCGHPHLHCDFCTPAHHSSSMMTSHWFLNPQAPSHLRVSASVLPLPGMAFLAGSFLPWKFHFRHCFFREAFLNHGQQSPTYHSLTCAPHWTWLSVRAPVYSDRNVLPSLFTVSLCHSPLLLFTVWDSPTLCSFPSWPLAQLEMILSVDWSSFLFPTEAEALEGWGTSVVFSSALGGEQHGACFTELAQVMFVEQMNGIPKAWFCVDTRVLKWKLY